MSREIGAQMGMLERELEHDRDMRALERLHGLISQGAKGLSILSGGAAVALLAFVQALIDKPAYLGFKCFAVSALACFLISAFLPAIAFFFHFSSLNKPHHDKREKNLKAVWWLLSASSALLFAGGLITFIGVWVAL
jgi:uncharacterized protein YoaH (UPF0181 family)